MFDFWRWPRIDWSGLPAEDEAMQIAVAEVRNVRRPEEPTTCAMTTRAFIWSDLKAQIDRETGGAA